MNVSGQKFLIMRIYQTRIELVKDLVTEKSVCVEMGVLYGGFAQHIYNQNPKKLYLVDLWNEPMPCGDEDGNNVYWSYDNIECFNNLTEQFSNSNNVIISKTDSVSFMKSCDDDYFDFIYIDTTHTYEQTLRELEVSFSKCKNGGYICNHDFSIISEKCKSSNFNFDVDKAVYEFCTKYNQKIHAIALDGCISSVIKKSI